ncbi:MAG: 30S ribosomal protein S12 methylthiotransferase RimO [Verrucomicrobiae bacterium]|nr:30S ribosomal protein S12 methylthiotransferase RimO [Verrucomicrobiae bacterium]
MKKSAHPPKPPAPLKVGLVSLGCAKNLVDSEIMLGRILQEGMQVTNNPEEADCLIVNTCSFIDSAKEEAVENILQANRQRGLSRRKEGQALVVAGCMAQRFAGELQREMPEVDAFMGIDQVEKTPEIIRAALTRRDAVLNGVASALPAHFAEKSDKAEEHVHDHSHEPVADDPLNFVTRKPTYIPDYQTPRFRLTPDHFAYLKIGEGCNHPCSFCIIPQMRGKHRSRSMDSVVQEARGLVESGVREINLISQDTTFWGKDLRGEKTERLQDLLTQLNAIEGDFWVRLLYTHPYHWSQELIDTIARLPKVARYIDMPLQHIHDGMLLQMRRETSSAHIRDLISRIRAGIPGIAIRTTFIVGFPGETEEHFEALLDFIGETKFDRLGIFTYSQEDGTRAAKMEGQLGDAVKKSRYKKAMKLQRRIAAEVSRAQIGKTLRVLVERDGVARSQADAPDIDGRVLLPEGSAPVGAFCEVKIIGALDYDLIGEPVSVVATRPVSKPVRRASRK